MLIAKSRRVRFASRRAVTLDTAPIPTVLPAEKPQPRARVLALAPIPPAMLAIAMLASYLIAGAP